MAGGQDGPGMLDEAGESGEQRSMDTNELFEMALQRLRSLYELHEGLVVLDLHERSERLMAERQALLSLLDQFPATGRSKKERATLSYIRGKAFDAGEEYSAEAEQDLSRAVKLDPSLGDAWNQLGTCLWKKGEVQLAHDCWQNTLLHCSNVEDVKGAMRKLSMAHRVKGKNPEESLRLAKELVSRDMSDSHSWTNLGNAYMSYFFSLSLDREDLFRALKAYHKSDQDGQSRDPDLHFNKATVYRYLEDYHNAVLELLRAHALDPELNASEQIVKVARLVNEMHAMIARQCNLKAEKIQSMLLFLPPPAEPLPVGSTEYVDCVLADMAEGWNLGRVLHVMIFAIPNTERPIHLVVSDRSGSFFAVSVYNMPEGKLKPGDVISALSPYMRTCSLPADALLPLPRHPQLQSELVDCCFKCVQVSPGQLLHNGFPCDISYYERPRAVFTVSPVAVRASAGDELGKNTPPART
ncbi:hypothetical protein GUITHDRAFT_122091 [Guillardia theta CCMP2712]|uniref:Tetratricopeptide repeat protein 5 OB fold domain-containing protein n=2 Tax=Guillardia theta TaxID=55529 RepID=L1I6L4_GUITC|nr:hypothetical protein GUITHDRAFT_122091 [Guillardia theta CCMP2712]EKX31722.1 hypothetical protein GUITHDRAFT_122091 [Guillardia theta CCMP2712]|mmetsp:Transcript_8425/g.28273  ORF Transcript_8425/g.28273 Transcript_8425/m.28273 type:complete len:469 (+) Transcript_8425:241-1647(+)|eukprot:XP_005818702.1 hypothetical protein GUITHDRAFT_122091 [Guillardia theta CCMP2712]